uniref:Polyprotein n=1 Tax=Rhizoctonia solani beny-like virus 1 TaxID=1708385 RepID=A0A5B8HDH6_9VIRU|nr:polyprotein [Rhizoctonia solani beny-like virus 1]
MESADHQEVATVSRLTKNFSELSRVRVCLGPDWEDKSHGQTFAGIVNPTIFTGFRINLEVSLRTPGIHKLGVFWPRSGNAKMSNQQNIRNGMSRTRRHDFISRNNPNSNGGRPNVRAADASAKCVCWKNNQYCKKHGHVANYDGAVCQACQGGREGQSSSSVIAVSADVKEQRNEVFRAKERCLSVLLDALTKGDIRTSCHKKKRVNNVLVDGERKSIWKDVHSSIEVTEGQLKEFKEHGIVVSHTCPAVNEAAKLLLMLSEEEYTHNCQGSNHVYHRSWWIRKSDNKIFLHPRENTGWASHFDPSIFGKGEIYKLNSDTTPRCLSCGVSRSQAKRIRSFEEWRRSLEEEEEEGEELAELMNRSPWRPDHTPDNRKPVRGEWEIRAYAEAEGVSFGYAVLQLWQNNYDVGEWRDKLTDNDFLPGESREDAGSVQPSEVKSGSESREVPIATPSNGAAAVSVQPRQSELQKESFVAKLREAVPMWRAPARSFDNDIPPQVMFDAFVLTDYFSMRDMSDYLESTPSSRLERRVGGVHFSFVDRWVTSDLVDVEGVCDKGEPFELSVKARWRWFDTWLLGKYGDSRIESSSTEETESEFYDRALSSTTQDTTKAKYIPFSHPSPANLWNDERLKMDRLHKKQILQEVAEACTEIAIVGGKDGWNLVSGSHPRRALSGPSPYRSTRISGDVPTIGYYRQLAPASTHDSGVRNIAPYFMSNERKEELRLLLASTVSESSTSKIQELAKAKRNAKSRAIYREKTKKEGSAPNLALKKRVYRSAMRKKNMFSGRIEFKLKQVVGVLEKMTLCEVKREYVFSGEARVKWRKFKAKKCVRYLERKKQKKRAKARPADAKALDWAGYSIACEDIRFVGENTSSNFEEFQAQVRTERLNRKLTRAAKEKGPYYCLKWKSDHEFEVLATSNAFVRRRSWIAAADICAVETLHDRRVLFRRLRPLRPESPLAVVVVANQSGSEKMSDQDKKFWSSVADLGEKTEVPPVFYADPKRFQEWTESQKAPEPMPSIALGGDGDCWKKLRAVPTERDLGPPKSLLEVVDTYPEFNLGHIREWKADYKRLTAEGKPHKFTPDIEKDEIELLTIENERRLVKLTWQDHNTLHVEKAYIPAYWHFFVAPLWMTEKIYKKKPNPRCGFLDTLSAPPTAGEDGWITMTQFLTLDEKYFPKRPYAPFVPKSLQVSLRSLYHVKLGSSGPDALIKKAMEINGPSIAMQEATVQFNNEVGSMPAVPFLMSEAEKLRFSSYVGRAVRALGRKCSWNDHLFLEAARHVLREQLYNFFPHATDIQTVLHVGSTAQELRKWRSHAGHDFQFAMAEDKDLARVLEDASKELATAIGKAAPPSLKTKNGGNVSITLDNLQLALKMCTLEGRDRICVGKTFDRSYNVQIYEDVLYSMEQGEMAALWEKHGTHVGYATMFFPHAMIDPHVEPSSIYEYSEYFDPAVTATWLADKLWPSILLLSPMIPLKGAAKALQEAIRTLSSFGWEALKNWVSAVTNDNFPLQVLFFSSLDILKIVPIFQQVLKNLKPVFRRLCMRAKVYWRGGVSNGYDHPLRVWEPWLKSPRIKANGFFIDSEIVTRVGELYLMRFWRSTGSSHIVRSLQLPLELDYVRVADLEASWDGVNGVFNSFTYKSYRASTWKDMLNWCMAQPANSIDFAVVQNAVNRVSKGLSVGANILAEAAPHDRGDNSALALALVMETFKRKNILHEIESNEDLRNGYSTQLKVIAEKILKTGFAIVTGGLGVAAWMVYKYLCSRTTDYEFVKYSVPPEEIHVKPVVSGAPPVNPGPLRFVVPPDTSKHLNPCRICDYQEKGYFSATGVANEGQLFHKSKHEREGNIDISMSDSEVITGLAKVRDARTWHQSKSAKVWEKIKKFEDWVETQQSGIDKKIHVDHIRGGPGTGKSEVIKAMLYRMEKSGIPCAVTMPFAELCKDYVQASVLGVSGKHSFKADTLWYSLQHSNIDTFIVDETTGVDWVIIKLVCAYLGVKNLILVGDRGQTHLRSEAGEGIDPTSILADLDWDEVPEHELVFNYRLGAWRVKMLNKLFGYKMIPKRTDDDRPIFIHKDAYFSMKEQGTPIDIELVFSHAAAPLVFGTESSSEREAGKVNLSIRSSQGLTKEYSAVGVTDLDKATIQVPGFICVGMSRSKRAPYIVYPEGEDTEAVVQLKKAIGMDTEANQEAIWQSPLPLPPETKSAVVVSATALPMESVISELRNSGKLIAEKHLSVEGDFMYRVPDIKGKTVDLTLQDVSFDYSNLIEFYKTIFHWCIFDELIPHMGVNANRVVVSICEKIYCDDALMGRKHTLDDSRKFSCPDVAVPVAHDVNGNPVFVVKKLLPVDTVVNEVSKACGLPIVVKDSRNKKRNIEYMSENVRLGAIQTAHVVVLSLANLDSTKENADYQSNLAHMTTSLQETVLVKAIDGTILPQPSTISFSGVWVEMHEKDGEAYDLSKPIVKSPTVLASLLTVISPSPSPQVESRDSMSIYESAEGSIGSDPPDGNSILSFRTAPDDQLSASDDALSFVTVPHTDFEFPEPRTPVPAAAPSVAPPARLRQGFFSRMTTAAVSGATAQGQTETPQTIPTTTAAAIRDYAQQARDHLGSLDSRNVPEPILRLMNDTLSAVYSEPEFPLFNDRMKAIFTFIYHHSAYWPALFGATIKEFYDKVSKSVADPAVTAWRAFCRALFSVWNYLKTAISAASESLKGLPDAMKRILFSLTPKLRSFANSTKKTLWEAFLRAFNLDTLETSELPPEEREYLDRILPEEPEIVIRSDNPENFPVEEFVPVTREEQVQINRQIIIDAQRRVAASLANRPIPGRRPGPSSGPRFAGLSFDFSKLSLSVKSTKSELVPPSGVGKLSKNGELTVEHKSESRKRQPADGALFNQSLSLLPGRVRNYRGAVLASTYLGKTEIARTVPSFFDVDQIAVNAGVRPEDFSDSKSFIREVAKQTEIRIQSYSSFIVASSSPEVLFELGFKEFPRFRCRNLKHVPMNMRRPERDKSYEASLKQHCVSIDPDEFASYIKSKLQGSSSDLLRRSDTLHRSTFVPLVDPLLGDEYRRRANEIVDLQGVYMLREDEQDTSIPGYNNDLRCAGKDTQLLHEFISPCRWDDPPMLNDYGPYQGMQRLNNAEISWGNTFHQTTKSGAPRPFIDTYALQISSGLANQFGTSLAETINASERIGQLREKPRLDSEKEAWAKRVAKEVVNQCWERSEIGIEEHNRALYEGWSDARRRNYGPRTDAEWRKTFGEPKLVCNNKAQQKPIKEGKLDVLKTGQLIVQSPPDVNLKFIGMHRIFGRILKASCLPHFFLDDYEDPDSFCLRLTQAITSLPESSNFCIMDFTEFDSQQNEVTVAIEKEVWRLMGIPTEWVDEYYCYRQKGLSVVMPKLFKLTMNQEKPSGFLDTKSGNTILSCALASQVVEHVGPYVHAAKGDDTLIVGNSLAESVQGSKEVRAYTGMGYKLEISSEGGEFIGCSVSRGGIFKSITRTAMKAIAKPAKDFEQFKEQQKALRDHLDSWRRAGVYETICNSAAAEKKQLHYVQLCYDFVVCLSSISREQFDVLYKSRKWPRFALRTAGGPELLA